MATRREDPGRLSDNPVLSLRQRLSTTFVRNVAVICVASEGRALDAYAHRRLRTAPHPPSLVGIDARATSCAYPVGGTGAENALLESSLPLLESSLPLPEFRDGDRAKLVRDGDRAKLGRDGDRAKLGRDGDRAKLGRDGA